MFEVSSNPLNRELLSRKLLNDKAGALVTFEGWVRNHNQGEQVSSLEYQIYEILALSEGKKIVEEAKDKFNIHNAFAVHRHGHLLIGDLAVWVGAVATHRDDAFKATRYIIDEIKHRLPVWKKEHYVNNHAHWVFCKDHHHHVHFHEQDYYRKQAVLTNQEKLKSSKVLVIGAGGLGVPCLLGLTAAGVGEIAIADHDKIEISNVHRQVIYHPGLVGESKAFQAASYMSQLNPFIKVNALKLLVDESNAHELFSAYDLIFDCTDNLKSKYLIHDICLKLKKPLVSASVYKYEATLRTFSFKEGSGCLRCIQKTTPNDSKLGNCNDFGVLATTVNIIGSIQASEGLLFLQKGCNNSELESYFYNLKDLSQLKLKNFVDENCHYCRGDFSIEENAFEVCNDEAKRMDAQILDIRNLTDEDILSNIQKDKKVVLCCFRGIRSSNLVRNLHEKGYKNYYSLKGGACSL